MRRLLGSAFGTLASLRVAAYRRGLLPRARLAGPVVSVGNLGVGGSGKTPVVARVAEILRDAGEGVAVLSRGYGGSFRGEALVVSDGSRVLAGAAEAGDEPVMLARALPGVVVAVGPRRDVVGRAVEARFGRRVHVLDDGFQHLRLERDLDLVCLDVRDLEDRPMPAGRLRERPSALARASLVLLTRIEAASEAELRALEGRLSPGAHAPRRAPRGGLLGPRRGRGAARRAFLLAAIARPERFERDVAGCGVGVLGRAFFRDHHRFRPDDLAGVAARARAAGAEAIVTTAKDAVRLEARPSPELPVVVLGIAAEIRTRRACARGCRRSRGGPPEARAAPRARGRGRRRRVGGRRRLPRRVVLALGRRLGRLWAALDPRHLAIAADNLRQAFPDWDEARVQATARGVYAHFATVLLDILWMEGRPVEELLALADVEGLEHLRPRSPGRRGRLPWPTSATGSSRVSPRPR